MPSDGPSKRTMPRSSTTPQSTSSSPLLSVLFNDDHGESHALEQLDLREDLLGNLRRKTERWFVEHEQDGIDHQRPTHGQHLLLSARHLAGVLAGPILEDGEHLVHPVEALLDDGGSLTR